MVRGRRKEEGRVGGKGETALIRVTTILYSVHCGVDQIITVKTTVSSRIPERDRQVGSCWYES